MTIRATDPTSLKRIYPHVSEISDWQTAQTIRLLWDRVWALEERLQAAQTTITDLVAGHNENAATLDTVGQDARQALAGQQAGDGTGVGGAGSGTGGAGGSGSATPQALPEGVCTSLHAERAKYGGTMTNAEAGQLLNAVAYAHRATGWGLSRKDGGNHAALPFVGNIAVDILQLQPSNYIFDVLGSSGGGGPTVVQCGTSIGIMTDPTRPFVAPAPPW